MTRFYVAVSTADGDVAVYEDELASITNSNSQKWLGISRKELVRVFAEAKRMMADRGIEPDDHHRIYPCADEHLDGRWRVMLAKHSPLTDPLMQGEPPPPGKRS